MKVAVLLVERMDCQETEVDSELSAAWDRAGYCADTGKQNSCGTRKSEWSIFYSGKLYQAISVELIMGFTFSLL